MNTSPLVLNLRDTAIAAKVYVKKKTDWRGMLPVVNRQALTYVLSVYFGWNAPQIARLKFSSRSNAYRDLTTAKFYMKHDRSFQKMVEECRIYILYIGKYKR